MKNVFSLNARIDELLKKKLSNCECNPCTCSAKTKEEYFQELNAVLTSFNIETFAYYLYRDHFQKSMNL